MKQKVAVLCYGVDACLMGRRALAVEPEPVGIALSRRLATLTLNKRVPLTLPVAVSMHDSPLP